MAFEQWEPHIRSFVCRTLHDDPVSGPLTGLTLGVKDIIDVAGVPTRNGSATCQDAPPAAQDAAVVAALRASGARIVGKTVTTEFALTDPTECRNPYDLTRTPGGSSSGSGAAVAAGLVDMALGTQTAGSLCRPAAYCGVVGLKPTYGALPMAGITPLARSFDTVGVIARSVAVARSGFLAMAGEQTTADGPDLVATCMLMPGDVRPEPEMEAAFGAASAALSDMMRVVNAPSVSVDPKAIVDAHRTVMHGEAAEAHGHLLSAAIVELLRPRFRAALEAGAKLEADQIDAARRELARAAKVFWQAMDAVDIILTLPVPEGAPRLGDGTGFQDWLTPWTVFGGPLISLPWGLDRLGRPCAVMLAGKPGADMLLLDVAAQLERFQPELPPPNPPAG